MWEGEVVYLVWCNENCKIGCIYTAGGGGKGGPTRDPSYEVACNHDTCCMYVMSR